MALEISVVIPTFRDWDRLKLCISALEHQSLPRDRFEIIVVDNDDQPLAEELRPNGVVYVHEPEGYSYTARNAGIRQAAGEIVAFTDADCIPDQRWLETGSALFRAEGGCDLVGGFVEMFADEDNVATRYELAFGLRQERYFKTWHGFATANVLVRKRVCDAIGGFNTRLESWGDFDFCRRAAAAGFKLRYAPNAIVRHPARANLKELLKKNRRVARGYVVFGYESRPASSHSTLKWLLRTFRPRPRDWYYTLAGGRGTEVLAWRKRPAVLALQIIIRYHFAWAHLVAIMKTRRPLPHHALALLLTALSTLSQVQ